VVVVLVDLDDIADQLHAVPAGVIDAADERADKIRPGLGSQDRLPGGKAQGHVHPDAFAAEHGTRSDAVPGQWHLHHDVFVDLGQLAALGEHALGVGGYHLSADVAVDDIADLADLLVNWYSLFGDQRRVGGDAVHNAP